MYDGDRCRELLVRIPKYKVLDIRDYRAKRHLLSFEIKNHLLSFTASKFHSLLPLSSHLLLLSRDVHRNSFEKDICFLLRLESVLEKIFCSGSAQKDLNEFKTRHLFHFDVGISIRKDFLAT